jgi:hypothetical protein
MSHMSHIVKINVFMICIFIIFKLVYFTTVNNKQQKMFFSKLATMYATPLLFSPKSGLAWFFNCLVYLNFVDDIVIKQTINSTYLFFNVVGSAVGKQEQKMPYKRMIKGTSPYCLQGLPVGLQLRNPKDYGTNQLRSIISCAKAIKVVSEIL